MNKIAVWKTGHPIADTVAKSLGDGLDSPLYDTSQEVGPEAINVGYGILRGMDSVFKQSKRYFLLDNGYFNPGHFNGYYRVSYKGTQAKYDAEFPISKEFDGGFVLPRKEGECILICPPSAAVCNFFGIDGNEWLLDSIGASGSNEVIISEKGDGRNINELLKKAKLVITFNSSVGWKAIQQGIPCLSDTQHSVVGSYYNTKSIDELIEKFNTMPRAPLFNFMRAHQFTLEEIAQGKAWPLMNFYLSGSAGIVGKQ